MSNYLENETTTIQWLDEALESLTEALKALDVTIVKIERFPHLTSAAECNLGNFWNRQRGGAVEVSRMVLWIVTGEHVQMVGSTTVSEYLPSVTVGTINYNAPMREGWARFQEYKYSASAGKRGIKIATVAERFKGYHEVVIDPSKATSKKKPKDSEEPVEFQNEAAVDSSTASPTEAPPRPTPEPNKKQAAAPEIPLLEMAAGPGGMVYVHIPMTLVPQTFALALEALMRGANGDVNMAATTLPHS